MSKIMIRINRLGAMFLASVTLFLGAVGVAQGLEKEETSKTNIVQYRGENCIELKDFNKWSVGVFRSGNYCVAQDLYQTLPMFRLPHQAVPMGALISIDSGNVTIDLMRHSLSAKIPYGKGVWLYDGRLLSNDGGRIAPYRAIRIGNGSITTSKQASVFMVHAGNEKNVRFYHKMLGVDVRSSAGKLADYDGDISQYRSTEYVLENLTLEADGTVIIMQGKSNVIRNCKIIGGNGAVNLYGPNLVFENNEIILRAKDQKEAGDEPPVALYLEDAADSVVRNNRIVIEGRATGSEAIVLKNSRNVTLEGNTITGAEEAYKLLDDRSSVRAAVNIMR